MSDERPPTLLDDLDQRQNQLLAELDLLDQRIARVLDEWSRDRPDRCLPS
jgi:hypothetical protein